jgi:hypothetical protein
LVSWSSSLLLLLLSLLVDPMLKISINGVETPARGNPIAIEPITPAQNQLLLKNYLHRIA